MSKPESVDRSGASDCYALVTMFGKWRRCRVTAHGEPQDRYSSERVVG